MNPALQRAYHLIHTEPDESMRLANLVLNDEPKNIDALFCAGRALIAGKRFGLASNLFARCMDLSPHRWEPMVNYALTLISINEFVESERFLHKALKIEPKATSALNNMALLNVHLGNPEKAIEYAKRSLAVDPNQPDPKESMGYANLMLGNFREGWEGYEAMLESNIFREMKPLNDEPYWKGEQGGTLYVQQEQGLGDEISFASVLPDAMRDNDIVLECTPKLEGLFRRSFPQIEVTTKNRRTRRKVDYGSLIGSLCHYYRNDAKDFPGSAFLLPDPERRAAFRALLDTQAGPKIGIAWTGGLKTTFAARRSLSLEAMLPVLSIPGVTWISLQYKDPTAEIAAFRKAHGIDIKHWSWIAESDDYDNQAALVAELDCVVTVTTAIAHLAGALGKPAFVLVPSKPRWFYGQSGITVPWYDSMRLFRQSDRWPLESVRNAVTKHIGSQERAAA
jgi:tetratricopeptide (TPR) repeat protein